MTKLRIEICENDEAVVAARAKWTAFGYTESNGTADASDGADYRVYVRKGATDDPPTARKGKAADGERITVVVFKKAD